MNLTLTDKLILLALDDDKGTFSDFAQGFEYALAGAVLLELNLNELMELKDQKVQVKPGAKTDDQVLMPYFALLKAAKKDRKIDYWLDKLSFRFEDIIKGVTDRLISQGILRKEEKTYLWVFTSKKYPTSNPRPENELRRNLIAMIENRQEPTVEDLMLISLVDACELNIEVYGKEKTKVHQKRIKALVEQSKNNALVNGTIKEVHDAIMACIVLMITTTVLTTTVITGN